MIKCCAVKFVPFGTDYPIIVAGPCHSNCYDTIHEHFGHSFFQSPDVVEVSSTRWISSLTATTPSMRP